MAKLKWNTPTLSKGQSITERCGDCTMSIEHVDRTIDPYLAGVVLDDIIIYTGLHPTLSSARQKCQEMVDFA
jgi:hypothetical protein